MDLLHLFLTALGVVVGLGVLLCIASIFFFLLVAIWKSYFEMLRKPTQKKEASATPSPPVEIQTFYPAPFQSKTVKTTSETITP